MIDEFDAAAAQFGVSLDQVERDHLISHLLAVIGNEFGDRIQFIGGTALARTYLPGGRLSEDIDLIALSDRKTLAAELDDTLPRAVQRTHGRLEWAPALSAVRDVAPARIRTTSGTAVKIQLLSRLGRIIWPDARQPLVQRYSDAPAVDMMVPTLPAFAASKTATWHDRAAPRDLWDLWALNGIGAIDAEAGALYRQFGPTTHLPADDLFDRPPEEHRWQAQLAGQTCLTVSAAEAAAAVRAAWSLVRQESNER